VNALVVTVVADFLICWTLKPAFFDWSVIVNL
jgi:hypothetical protein